MHSSLPPRTLEIVAKILIALTFLAGIYRATLVAWADLEYRQARPPAVHKAETLVPSNALYHYTSALILQQNDPTSPQIEREFASAVACNPRYSDALMAWSVEKELRGDKAGALELLTRAQAQDHLLRPTWALANFYFRQGDRERLVVSARECLGIIAGTGLSEGRFDPVPIFDLCWKGGVAPDRILTDIIPDNLPVLDHYFSYLFNNGRLPAARDVAARIFPQAQPTEMLFLRPYLEILIRNDQMADAADTWKRMFDRHLVPYPGPDTRQGAFVTDGDLAGPPLSFGFDWRSLHPDAVQFLYSRGDRSYRWEFDGNEPEQLSLLMQTVPIRPGNSYRFTARFRSDADAQRSGIRWSAANHRDGQHIPDSNLTITESETRTLSFDFAPPAGTDTIDLHLDYNRQPGTSRMRGFYELLGAGLQLR